MRYPTLILTLLLSFTSYCQDSILNDPLSIIDQNPYFHNYNVENFYLHTSKSLYFTEEHLFFKAYVVNEVNLKPSQETTNLYVNLYDFNNTLILTQLFYVKNGITNGSIKLPKDLESGEYTLVLDTNWNKNFKEGSRFSVQIKNLNDTEASLTINNEEKTVSTTKTQIQSNLKNTGFLLKKTDTNNTEFINFKLITDKKTIASKDDKLIYAVLHKKGVIATNAPFNLSEKIATYNLNFLKTDLFQGLNTISVFDSKNQLLAEHNFYYTNNKKADIYATKINKTKDSLTLNLKLFNVSKEANISISVLHQESNVIDYNSKITKTLLNENLNIDTTEDTDKPLKGFNSLPYKSIKTRKLLFKNEKGLTIKGHLNSTIENPEDYTIGLTSNTNNIVQISPLKSNKNFEFNNLVFLHPSEYAFLLMDKEEKLKKADFYVYNSFINYRTDSILRGNKPKPVINTETDNQSVPLITSQNTNLPKSKGVEFLDEVILENVKKKKEKRIREIKKENPFMAINAGFSRDYLIDPEKDFLTLEQYLRTKVSGLRVVYDGPRVFVYNTRRNAFGGMALINIMYDGVLLRQSDTDGLIDANQNVTNFELISINPSGLGGGITAENGVLTLITKRGNSEISKNAGFAKEFKTSVGFNLNQAKLDDNNIYYPSSKSENTFGSIDWIPNFTLKPNSSNTLKIRKPENENVKLIINGISEDGDLIYKVIDL